MLVGTKASTCLRHKTNSHRVRPVSLRLASVMIHVGVKTHDHRQAEGVPDRYTEETSM